MDTPKSYCEFTRKLEKTNLHKIYHDTKYGFEIKDDNELFGRLILEINQAGLSWDTILKKEEKIRKAFSNYNINEISNYNINEINELLHNKGIIRNKLKINSIINNAKKIIKIQNEFGSFKNWLDKNHPKELNDWIKLFKREFKFTGGEITKEFLMSTGYLKGAHIKNCPKYDEILKLNPKWNN